MWGVTGGACRPAQPSGWYAPSCGRRSAAVHSHGDSSMGIPQLLASRYRQHSLLEAGRGHRQPRTVGRQEEQVWAAAGRATVTDGGGGGGGGKQAQHSASCWHSRKLW